MRNKLVPFSDIQSTAKTVPQWCLNQTARTRVGLKKIMWLSDDARVSVLLMYLRVQLRMNSITVPKRNTTQK